MFVLSLYCISQLGDQPTVNIITYYVHSCFKKKEVNFNGRPGFLARL